MPSRKPSILLLLLLAAACAGEGAQSAPAYDDADALEGAAGAGAPPDAPIGAPVVEPHHEANPDGVETEPVAAPEPPAEASDEVADEPIEAAGKGHVAEIEPAIDETQLDDDADGVTNDRDLCPRSAAGDTTDADGCSQTDRATDHGPRSGSIGDWGPDDDGSVDESGFATFVLDARGDFPLVLRARETGVTVRPTGFDLNTTVLVDVPGQQSIVLREASVSLDRNAEGWLERINGTVRLPFPDVGFMEGVSVSGGRMVQIGYDYAANIDDGDDAPSPLDDARKYLFFVASAGLEAEIGGLKMSSESNQSVLMAIDPSDATFYGEASLGGVMGDFGAAAFGISVGGHLWFVPENTWGIEETATSFQGHYYAGGSASLLEATGLPLSVGGSVVYDLDPNDDGVALFRDPADGYQFGVNGEVSFSASVGPVSFEVPIGQSTLIGRLSTQQASADFSGVIAAQSNLLPAELIPVTTWELRAAGHLSTVPGESHFVAEGATMVQSGRLGEWIGVELQDLEVARTRLYVDNAGVLVNGAASGRLSRFVGFSNEVALEAFFNGNREDWYVDLDGALVVSGVALGNAHARLAQSGVAIRGSYRTPISQIAMAGSLTRSGVHLAGRKQVSMTIAGRTFSGHANVVIGNAGVGGNVSVGYCGKILCEELTGDVRLTSQGLKACVEVARGNEVCVAL